MYTTSHKNMFNPRFDWLWIVLAALVFVLTISLTACGPQSRLNRIVKAHPELSIENNVVITDTLYLPKITVDTMFSNTVDTLILTNDSIKITYIKIKDKIYLKGETIRVPVIVTKTVKVKSPVITKTVIAEHWYHRPLIWWFIISLAVIIIALLMKLSKGYLKGMPI